MINSALIPKRDILNILGSLCKAPQLLMSTETYEFKVEDFGEDFYKILFSAINNITVANIDITEIKSTDIDNEIAKINKNYKIYEANNGFAYINQAIECCNIQIFDSNYNRMKKFALLRDLERIGFDSSIFYDYNSIDLAKQAEQIKELENMSMDDIINKVNEKLVSIKDIWEIDGCYQSFEISDGLDTLLEELHSDPEYGYPYANKYYNAIFYGAKKKKLVIRSAGTGVGKTRLALADIAQMAADEIWDLDKKCWVQNGFCIPCSFISTELEKKELQTCLLAIISGVSEEVIKKGNFTPDIYDRVYYAIQVLKKSPIFLHYIDDFSVYDIEKIIEKDVIKNDVEAVFFDYIQSVPKLSRVMQESYGGMALREDQILVNLSSRLKLLANKYNIYLSTATQLNRNSKEHDNRDTSSIRGGRKLVLPRNLVNLQM